MIADLHAHYPMHLVPEDKGSAIWSGSSAGGAARLTAVTPRVATCIRRCQR